MLAQSKREHAATLPDPSGAIEQARELREQAVAVMEALADREDEIARIYEDLASGRPGRRDEYRRTAAQARTGARRAREAVRKFTA
jgi:hypothetical protein